MPPTPPPEAVHVVDKPEQIEVAPPVMLQVGSGLTVSVLEQIVEQLNEFVMVTL